MRSLQDYAASYAVPDEPHIMLGNSIIGAAAILQIYEDYVNTLKIVQKELAEEAEKREWCEEYDWFMGRLDDLLPNPISDLEDRTIRVRFEVTMNVNLKSVRRSRSDMSAFEHYLMREDIAPYAIAHSLMNEMPGYAEWVGYEYHVND